MSTYKNIIDVIYLQENNEYKDLHKYYHQLQEELRPVIEALNLSEQAKQFEFSLNNFIKNPNILNVEKLRVFKLFVRLDNEYVSHKTTQTFQSILEQKQQYLKRQE